MIKFIFYSFAILVLQSIVLTQDNGTSDYEFIPSKEWKIVKPGQKIPPGLHIRSNLQTGVTEAKLMDDNDDSHGGVILSPETSNTTEENAKEMSPDHIKRMLKNLKNDNYLKESESTKVNGTKFRSYEELQKEFESLQMTVKTDLEIIRELMEEIKTNIGDQRKTEILQDMEFYLHQVDNAVNFVDMNGLQILYNFIDGDHEVHKSEAMRCLASALQGNTKVKIAAMKSGTIGRLLIHLKSTSDQIFTNRVLVTLSALTRQFPLAQISFLNGGGLEFLAAIYDGSFNENNVKTLMRIITIISDWHNEREFLKMQTKEYPTNEMLEKYKQYQRPDLRQLLHSGSWCNRLTKAWLNESDYSLDFYEKLVVSFVNFYPLCQNDFIRDNKEFALFIDRVNEKLKKSMTDVDDSDFYIEDMAKLVAQAKSLINNERINQEL